MTMDGDRIAQEAAFINTDERWPWWPILPVKNLYKPYHNNDKLGVVLAHEKTTVYLVGLFDLKEGEIFPQLENKPKEVFGSVQEMVSAGWVSD